MNIDYGIKGKKALVCASSKGLGFACARSLALAGADLIMCARDKDQLVLAAQKIEKETGVKTTAIPADLSVPESMQKFAKQILETHGGVDILVNNIGGPPPSSAVETSVNAWQQGFNQIFMSAVGLTQALIPHFKQQQWGRVITITSLSVVEPIDHLVVSTAMRTAVTTFMKTLSKEVAPFNITVNTALPGVIHTDRIVNLRAAKASRDGTTLDTEMSKTANTIPMRRLGRPEELGHLVAFLASEYASYITGANIPVDGGLRQSW